MIPNSKLENVSRFFISGVCLCSFGLVVLTSKFSTWLTWWEWQIKSFKWNCLPLHHRDCKIPFSEDIFLYQYPLQLEVGNLCNPTSTLSRTKLLDAPQTRTLTLNLYKLNNVLVIITQSYRKPWSQRFSQEKFGPIPYEDVSSLQINCRIYKAFDISWQMKTEKCPWGKAVSLESIANAFSVLPLCQVIFWIAF